MTECDVCGRTTNLTSDVKRLTDATYTDGVGSITIECDYDLMVLCNYCMPSIQIYNQQVLIGCIAYNGLSDGNLTWSGTPPAVNSTAPQPEVENNISNRVKPVFRRNVRH